MNDFNTSALREHANRELTILKTPDGPRSTVLRILKLLHENLLSEADNLRCLMVAEGLYQQFPISPLTGEDNEWKPLDPPEDGFTHVNVRCGHVFKLDSGQAVDAMRFAFKTGDNQLVFDARSVGEVTFPYLPEIGVVASA